MGWRETSGFAVVLAVLTSACARPAPPVGASSHATGGGRASAVTSTQPAPGAPPPVSRPGSPALFGLPVPPAVDQALTALQRSLGTRLQAALAGGGPVAALAVCHTEAPSLALAAQLPGISIGRTSHRLRNPRNAPPGWAADAVARGASLPLGSATAQTFSLPGGKAGLLRPIPTAPVCLACHGDAATLPAELRAALAERYPADQATGFAAGSLRGWLWAEWTLPAP